MRNLLTTIFFNVLLTTLVCGQTNFQCDSITVYNGEFDKLFQDEYNSIKSDTVLAIRHCYSTNGCSNTFGLLCWKVNGQYHFKEVQRKNGKIKVLSKLDKELVEHLINFYDKKIFDTTVELEEKDLLFIDDGPLTLVLYRTKVKCWRFNIGYSNSTTDMKVAWTKKLLALMRKSNSW